MTEFWNRCEGQSAGSYLLGKHLGGFSSSAVYAAVSVPGSQPFAVKLLRTAGAEREQRLNAWSALIPLSHPNLIRIIEAGQCEIDGVSLLYLVMERADGDLAGVLEERPLTVEEAKETLDPVLQALAYLHERGYGYGGLEPSRILAVGEQVKLSSDCITRSGQTQSVRARSVYDPPEWEEGAVSPEGDGWSLGATLVYALTQKPPDPALGRTDDFVSPILPEPFLTIVRNCLRRDPKSRWSLAQIASYLHGTQPASPPPAPVYTEPESRGSRKPFPWMVAAVLTAITIFVLLLRNRTPSETLPQPAPAAASSSTPSQPEPSQPEVASAPPKAIDSRGNWFVVVATYARKEDAEKRARLIERESPPFKAEVYAPARSAKRYYLVVIGSNLSEKEAIDLRARAGRVAADAYITTFNP